MNELTYNIPAIETKYRGMLFRSRLEARWAAFFDRAGWHWEYEPFDLHGWVPDFAIRAPTARTPILVEVKPILEMHGPTIKRVERAISASGLDYEALLLGSGIVTDNLQVHAYLGWLGEHAVNDNGVSVGVLNFAPALLVNHRQLLRREENIRRCGSMNLDFYHTEGSWRCRMSGFYDGNAVESHLLPYDHALEEWSRAHEATKYRPR
jgi:hypothetical protein